MPRTRATAPRLRADLAGLAGYSAGRPPVPPAGVRGHKMSSNEDPHPPLPSVVEAVARGAAHLNRYPDFASTELVGALAGHLGVPPERVAVGTGSSALLSQALLAACAPGDEVVFAWRSFESYPIATAVAGATAVRVPLTDDGRHDLPAMAAAVGPRTRVVLVCSPNNPTGTVVGAHELERFLDAVPDDVLVVLDEAYAEYVRDPDAARGLDVAARRGSVVVLRSFSKAYGLAGLRVGYAVAHPAVAAAVRATAVPFGVSGVAQLAAVASLAAREELLARVAAVVAERERVTAALVGAGWRLPRSQGNFVWLPLGGRTEAFTRAAADRGLAVRPFAGEGVRVTVGDPDADDELLAVAAAFAG